MVVAQHYRPERQEKMVWIILAYLAFAIGSVLVYAKGGGEQAVAGPGSKIRNSVVSSVNCAVVFYCLRGAASAYDLDGQAGFL